MKKLLSAVIFSFLISFFCFAESRFLQWDAGITTGFPIYDMKAADTKKELLTADDFKRVVAGINADLQLNLSEPLKLVFGVDSMLDFVWLDDEHNNTIDYGFYSAIKFYPGLEGLNFSIGYELGSRTDFIKSYDTDDASEEPELKNSVKQTAWGNGFRIALEYDIFYNKNVKVAPCVGVYYRFIPRGNYENNHILALYVNLKF